MKLYTKVAMYILGFILVFSYIENIEARKPKEARRPQVIAAPKSQSDTDIVRAVNEQRRVHFVEGAEMTVVQILPDDTSGSKHQKWTVRLSNGKTMKAVYNLDMCPHVPLKVGDVVAMGGEFIWTGGGGLLHWLHHDPRGTRPDGYVYVNGEYYCKN